MYPKRYKIVLAQIKFISFILRVMIRQKLKFIITFFLFLFFISIFWKSALYFKFPDSVSEEKRTILIPKNATAAQVLDTLYAKQLIASKKWSYWLSLIFHFDRKFKSGLYEIPIDLNDYHTLKFLINAPQKLIKVTIPEGLTYKKIAGKVASQILIDSSSFVHLCEDSVFLRSLGIKTNNIEGYLLADTYFFHYGISEREIVKRLVNAMFRLFERDSIQQRLKEINWNMHQVLTLASIVEGEAIYKEEMGLIASTYWNRLKHNWKLQADPTIQYLLDDGPRRLLYKDLKIDSPYNTYKYRGLPPGPINNPGIHSILAVLFPPNTDYFYFVATGDGKHHFSKTLKEHNQWKRKFNKIRKRVYGK